MSKTHPALATAGVLLIAAGSLAITPELLSTASRFEGSGPTTVTPAGQVVHHAYPDPAHGWKVPTICQGRTRGVFRGMTATADQCQVWIKAEYETTIRPALARLVRVPVTQAQAEALALFVDNVGEGQFAASQLLRRLNAGDCLGAAREWNASPQLVGGKPRIWRGRALVDRQTGAVLLATGSPVMKWTTAAGVPLPGLIKRRAEERARFEADCQYWED